MRRYDPNDERKIRVGRFVREWARSGLLDKEQHSRIAQELAVRLRETNVFFRLILFGFGIIIEAASVLLAGTTLGINGNAAVAALCFVSAIACFVVAELLSSQFDLYRFGIEEAATAGGAVLLALAGFFFTSSMLTAGSGEFPAFVGLIVGSMTAYAIYLRWGYLYAAVASMFCVSLAPFQSALSEVNQRLVAAGLLAIVFVVARSKRREHGDEFPGDDYGSIQAVACAGIYAFVNLQLSPVQSWLDVSTFPRTFYWFTYLMIWLLPAAGLYLALRGKDRALLDVNIALVLLTLATNKPYLGLARQAWDPIILGAALIGTAVILRRWLSNGAHKGFTATRLLNSDKRMLAMAGAASAALHTVTDLPSASSPSSSKDTFQGGGGRGGGAGASGSF